MVRSLLCLALLAGATSLAGCSPGDDYQVSVDAVRQAASGGRAAKCPVGFDVPGALRSAGVDRPVTPDAVDVEVSKTDTPAADPIAAQQNGMSALDAAAGAYLECGYQVDGKALTVRLVATRAKGAMALLAPQLQRDARLAVGELRAFLDAAPGPGEVKVVGGSVAVGALAATGGDAALMVSSEAPEVRDDALRTVAGELLGQVRF
ncbi:hypothetical protein OHS18_01365 [Amycolatopsis sp. NBC_00355]|uniref:hypothetical protein n=1 Tax=Amycolatopsis sp. NBC_00355 TaxID=2975957 RepID=UPI002E25675D